ncbi:MAG TPA: GAF domain-containing protein [Xanthomonadales bacterium]
MTGSDQFPWPRLIQQAEGLLSVTSNRISNAANLSALLYQELTGISWVGFYFLSGETLMLGPFQGKPACVSIEMGKGVCGTAAQSGKTIRVADVETFDGHIACDAAARSEIVVPLFKRGELIGVLDVDSTLLDRFGAEDEAGLNALAQVYLSSIE